MPFLDATSLAPADKTDIAAHKCGVVRPTDVAIAKQLYVCTHKFAVWHGTEPNWGLGYEDFADWSLGIATGDAAADEYLWNQWFFQVDALEMLVIKVFSHVEKQPYDTFAEWLHALDVARGKCTDAEVALDIANGITQCLSPHRVSVNSLGYEDVVTWGMLRNCPVGLRAAAVLDAGAFQTIDSAANGRHRLLCMQQWLWHGPPLSTAAEGRSVASALCAARLVTCVSRDG